MGLQRLTTRKAIADAEMDRRAKALRDRIQANGGASPVTTRRGKFTDLHCDECRHHRTTAVPEQFQDAPCPCRGCEGTMR
jgi:hypothetical protein